MGGTVDALKNNTTVRSLRDSLAADMVVLVSENTDYCGYATLWYSYSGSSTNWDAYAAVNSGCLSNQVLAHEVGHMQQLDHNRENATGMAAYAYSYGYRLCSSGGFYDIMSYACSTGVPKINYFSNPNVTYNGYPTGISYEANPGNSAETARTLNNTAAQVANYRVGSGSVAPTPPAAPSGLAVQGATYNSVSIGWNDNSTNETGFHVQRSSDGVNFALIATLGAGTRSFVDVTVLARSSYYYRVRAFNSAGASGYSSAVRATTPDTASLPAAPSSISAVNKGDGSALVSWVDSSGNETGFEVRRRKWDAKLRVWSSAIKVGSVPAGTIHLIDAAGNGTFRYFVRAVNSAGGETYRAGKSPDYGRNLINSHSPRCRPFEFVADKTQFAQQLVRPEVVGPDFDRKIDPARAVVIAPVWPVPVIIDGPSSHHSMQRNARWLAAQRRDFVLAVATGHEFAATSHGIFRAHGQRCSQAAD